MCRYIFNGTVERGHRIGAGHGEGTGNHASDIHCVHTTRVQVPSVAFAVLGDAQRSAVKETDSVKVLGADITDVAFQLGELGVVVGLISGGLGAVHCHGGQFTHPIQGFADFLQESILSLAVRNRTGEVLSDAAISLNLGIEFGGYSQTSCIILRANDSGP